MVQRSDRVVLIIQKCFRGIRPIFYLSGWAWVRMAFILLMVAVGSNLLRGTQSGEEIQRSVMTDGYTGQVSIPEKNSRNSSFVRVDFVAKWTTGTTSRPHSTIIHIGRSEKNGVRLDLLQTPERSGLSYYVIAGNSKSKVVNYKEFPLEKKDYGTAQISLLVTDKKFDLQIQTPATLFKHSNFAPRLNRDVIFLGEGPPDVVPEFTSVALYSSELLTSDILIERNINVTKGKLGQPLFVARFFQIVWFLSLLSLFLGVGFVFLTSARTRFVTKKLINYSPASTLINLSLALWVAVVPTWWIQGAYRGIPVTEVLSFRVQDGHCDASIQGIGGHCFGDYYYPVNLLPDTFIRNPGYSAVANFPFAITQWLESILNLGPRGGLLLYLAASGIALCVPAIYVLSRSFGLARFIVLVVLGVSALPVLITLDRGNNIAFIVPLLMGYVALSREKRYDIAAVCLSLACAIKPQFLLAYVLLLGLRQWRALVLGAVTFLSVTFTGFLVWPGDRMANIQEWVRGLLFFNTYGSGVLDNDYPPNLSAGRAIVQLSNIIEIPKPPTDFIGIITLIIVISTCFYRGKKLNFAVLASLSLFLPVQVPTLSFSYYLVVVLPIAALLLTAGESETGVHRQIPLLVVAVAVAVSIVPLPIAVGKTGGTFTPYFSGIVWLIVSSVAVIFAWLPNRHKAKTVTNSQS